MTESVLESVLEVSQLTKIYKKQRALDSFDLSVSRGEIVGIIRTQAGLVNPPCYVASWA